MIDNARSRAHELLGEDNRFPDRALKRQYYPVMQGLQTVTRRSLVPDYVQLILEHIHCRELLIKLEQLLKSYQLPPAQPIPVGKQQVLASLQDAPLFLGGVPIFSIANAINLSSRLLLYMKLSSPNQQGSKQLPSHR